MLFALLGELSDNSLSRRELLNEVQRRMRLADLLIHLAGPGTPLRPLLTFCKLSCGNQSHSGAPGRWACLPATKIVDSEPRTLFASGILRSASASLMLALNPVKTMTLDDPHSLLTQPTLSQGAECAASKSQAPGVGCSCRNLRWL